MSYHENKTNTALLEEELRELAAWYEWGSVPSYQVVAEVLQDAADAMRVKALSPQVAQVLIMAWRAFVDRESGAGNPPQMYQLVHDDTLVALKFAVKDLGRMLDEAHEDDKPRIAARLSEQADILAKYKGASHG